MISGNTPLYRAFFGKGVPGNGMMVEWEVSVPCNPATGVRSPKGSLRFLSSLSFPVKVIA